MKPHRLQETKKARGLAQVRMQLKTSLVWTSGYPVEALPGGGLRWVVPSEPDSEHSLVVERSTLVRASRIIKELRSDFPEALADVVGDVPSFVGGVARAIARATFALRDGLSETSLFGTEEAYGREAGEKAHRLVARYPSLSKTVRALSYAGLLRPNEALATLEDLHLRGHLFAAATSRITTRPPPRVWLELDLLRRAHRAALAGLERTLLDPHAHEVTLSRGVETAKALSSALGRLARRDPGAIPRAATLEGVTLGAAVVEWLPWLVCADTNTQRRALELYDLLDPHDAVPRWAEFWTAFRDLESRAIALGASVFAAQRSATVQAVGVAATVRKVDALVQTVPPTLGVAEVIDSIRRASEPEVRASYAEIVATLALLPLHTEDRYVRAKLLSDWTRELLREDEGLALRGFLSSLRGTLRKADLKSSFVLHPFVEAGRNGIYTNLTASLLTYVEPTEARTRFFAALESRARAATEPLTGRELVFLGDVAEHAKDAKTTEVWLEALLKVDGYVASELVGLASLLAADEPACFPALLTGLQRLDLEHGYIRHFSSWLDGPHRRALVRNAVLDGHGALLKDAFARRLALSHTNVKLPEPALESQMELAGTSAGSPSFADYPEALRPALARLACVAEEFDATAARLLGPAFRSLADLERELASLREKRATSDSVPLARRQTSLEAQLELAENDVSRGASPERLERLATKVDIATRRLRLEHWVSALDRLVDARLAESLGILPSPELRAPRTRECLVAILRLEPSGRSLARMVLSARMGPPPWDLRDHPANARFLSALTRRRVEVGPWLDGIGTHTEALPHKEKVTLRLEADPLEIMEMGRHFGTCLSPGAFNYFSVFSNLVDVNKRVVYARDANGRVIGRCLLALTAEGSIVAFHTYRHGSFDFDGMLERFVTELATRMRVLVLPRGTVPLLVASDWYDDGPVDIGGRLPFLEAESTLRKALSGIPLEDVRALCEREMAPLGPNELTLPPLLDLPEVTARPELALAFLELLRDLGSVPEHTQLRLASLLHAANRTDLIEETTVFEAARKAARSDRGLSGTLLRTLAALYPSSTLRLLRDTRPKGIRSFDDETDGERLLAAAEAMRALFRGQKARKLYRLAVQAGLSKMDKRLCQKRVLELKRRAR